MAVLNNQNSSFAFQHLVCPETHSDLEFTDQGLRSTDSGKIYAVENGIPIFSEPEAEPADENEAIAFRKRYEWQYQHGQDASNYDESFKTSARKRQRTRRELEIMSELLGSQGHIQSLLDIPCGGGRLTGPMLERCENLIEADISMAQLQLALNTHQEQGKNKTEGMIASAISIPLASNSVDGVVCARLTHHLPEPEERAKLVSELLRVAKSFVVVSFTDKNSIQSWSRKLRGKSLNPCAMPVSELENLTSKGNAVLKKIMTVSSIGPRHRFALLEKRS